MSTLHTSRSKSMYFDIFFIQVIKLLSTLYPPPLVVVTIQRHKTDVCDILHDHLRFSFCRIEETIDSVDNSHVDIRLKINF